MDKKEEIAKDEIKKEENHENKNEQIMDENKDSIRFYNLGKKYQSKIEHYGAKNTYDPEDILIV